MSDNFEYDDENEFQSGNGGDLVAQLRKAIKAKEKENKELRESFEATQQEMTGLRKQVNARTLADLLKEKGAEPGIAKFMADVEPSEESVSSWLAENGKFFGYNPKPADESQGQQQPQGTAGLDPEMLQILQSMQKVQKQEATAAPGLSAGEDKALDFINRVGQNAGSFEDVEKAFRQAGII